ncbi:phage terminase small subunit [Mogibacterium sp.]|uniref:phage terminase small subunit n=1 Tax=Mogibacterium sp. TaxID=2049035 RepID=UPI002580DFB0|nr:phage terminase small subunit [Mogibacterium sp.]
MAKEKYELAEQDYMNGMKYKDIADKYGVSLNTVKSWKKRYNWDRKGCTQKKKKGAHKNAIAQLGNKNATGPPGNKNAEKYGLFSKYLPEETLDIIHAVERANPLDLLWHQIQIAYAAIIRAQRIAFVENEYDKTIEQVEAKKGNIVGAKWEVQQAWDKQNNFLKAQARAQGELRSLIKQYDTMTDNEVPEDGRILFVSPTVYGMIRDLDTTKSKEILQQFAVVQKNGALVTDDKVTVEADKDGAISVM